MVNIKQCIVATAIYVATGFAVYYLRPMENTPKGVPVESIYKQKADSLQAVLNLAETRLYEDSVAYAELINNHRNEINTIDTMSLHSIYLLWGGQPSDEPKYGSSGGLYK